MYKAQKVMEVQLTLWYRQLQSIETFLFFRASI